jgi:hypothetical protein
MPDGLLDRRGRFCGSVCVVRLEHTPVAHSDSPARRAWVDVRELSFRPTRSDSQFGYADQFGRCCRICGAIASWPCQQVDRRGRGVARPGLHRRASGIRRSFLSRRLARLLSLSPCVVVEAIRKCVSLVPKLHLDTPFGAQFHCARRGCPRAGHWMLPARIATRSVAGGDVLPFENPYPHGVCARENPFLL